MSREAIIPQDPFLARSLSQVESKADLIEKRSDLISSIVFECQGILDVFGVTEQIKYRVSQYESRNVEKKTTPSVRFAGKDSPINVRLEEVVGADGKIQGYQVNYHTEEERKIGSNAGIHIRNRDRGEGFEVFNAQALEMPTEDLEDALLFVQKIGLFLDRNHILSEE